MLDVPLKVDRNCAFGMKENLVVLTKRNILVVLKLAANCNDTTCDSWDFGCIWQSYATFGFSLGLILQYEYSPADRLDVLQSVTFFSHILSQQEQDYPETTAAGLSVASVSLACDETTSAQPDEQVLLGVSGQISRLLLVFAQKPSWNAVFELGKCCS